MLAAVPLAFLVAKELGPDVAVVEDPTGEKAFLAATGQTPAQATATWQAWVRKL
jgi:hypothetical protein